MVLTMNPFKTTIALAALALALAFPLTAMAEATAKPTSESLQAYEQQLKAGEVQAATFNHYSRRMILTLKNGDHVVVHYEAHTNPKLESELKAKGVTVTVLSHGEAEKEAQSVKSEKPHTLRWIVIGVAVVVVLAIGIFFVTRKNRDRE